MAQKLLVIAQREDANEVISQEVLFVGIKLESFLEEEADVAVACSEISIKVEFPAHNEVTKRAVTESINSQFLA